MNEIAAFLFIVLVPLVVVAGAVVTLFAVGALFATLDNPGDLSGQVEAFFRGRLKPSKPVAEDHYYQQYWAEKPQADPRPADASPAPAPSFASRTGGAR